MTTLYLVRHAHAGEREAWRGPDSLRPLSPRGEEQAQGLRRLLAAEPIDRVESSPSLRCLQTVTPLAEALGLAVGESDLLLEGGEPAAAFTWLEQLLGRASVLACSHGDLVPALLGLAAGAGADVPPQPRWQKGSLWILRRDGSGWGEARYLPPAA